MLPPPPLQTPRAHDPEGDSKVKKKQLTVRKEAQEAPPQLGPHELSHQTPSSEADMFNTFFTNL
jgi:hypothetical protein